MPSAAWPAPASRRQLGFDVDDAHIILLDDVLYTGRTIRAVLNELFDYGRPGSVKLAVLVDRGGRELPVCADFAAARVALPPTQSLALARDEAGRFSFQVEGQLEMNPHVCDFVAALPPEGAQACLGAAQRRP